MCVLQEQDKEESLYPKKMSSQVCQEKTEVASSNSSWSSEKIPRLQEG
jgi:hypothetical protein